jgi:hypothetical protein
MVKKDLNLLTRKALRATLRLERRIMNIAQKLSVGI